MDNLFKDFASGDIIFKLLVVVMILIIITSFIIILSSNQEPKKHGSIIGKGKRDGDSSVNDSLKKGIKSGNQTDNATQSQSRQNVILNNQCANLSNEGYNSLLKKDSEKQKNSQQTVNDDGTIKTQIDFDLTNDESVPVINTPKYQYLETANGGQFRKLLPSDEKCFFKTWEDNGIRRFEFHKNVDKALANLNAVFDDVCEIEGKQNGATQIINVEPGILNGQLKVEKKAIIKLI